MQTRPTVLSNQTSAAAQAIPRYSADPANNPWGLSVQYRNEFNDNLGNFGGSFIFKSMNPVVEIKDQWKFYFRFNEPGFKILDRGNSKSFSILPAGNITADSREWFIFEPSEPFSLSDGHEVKVVFRGGYERSLVGKDMDPTQILWEYNPIVDGKEKILRAVFMIRKSNGKVPESPSSDYLKALKGQMYANSFNTSTLAIPILAGIGFLVVAFMIIKKRFYSIQDSKYM